MPAQSKALARIEYLDTMLSRRRLPPASAPYQEIDNNPEFSVTHLP